jgi:hypothetical protein
MKQQPPNNRPLRRGALTAMVALGIAACASPPQPGMEHGHLIQPKTTDGPFCEHHPFGEVKAGEVQSLTELKASEPIPFASDDHPYDAGKLLVLSHPLETLPLEVARIRRGLVKRFTGKFTREGIYAWSAIDLERLIAVSVERRVFDMRAHQSRPVTDPVFTQIEQLSFARRWTDGKRVEVEVIKVFPISMVEAQVFVCAANPLWADKRPLEEDDTYTELIDGVTDVFLMDRRQSQDVAFKYSKAVLLSPNLDNILGSIWQHAPRGPDW